MRQFKKNENCEIHQRTARINCGNLFETSWNFSGSTERLHGTLVHGSAEGLNGTLVAAQRDLMEL